MKLMMKRLAFIINVRMLRQECIAQIRLASELPTKHLGKNGSLHRSLDKQEKAVQTIVEQAEALCKDWTA